MILRLAFASVAAAVLLAGPVAAEEGGAAGVAAAAAPAVDFARYAGNIVRLSKIKVDPTKLEAYKAFAAEVGRESMRLEPPRRKSAFPSSKSTPLSRRTSSAKRAARRSSS